MELRATQPSRLFSRALNHISPKRMVLLSLFLGIWSRDYEIEREDIRVLKIRFHKVFNLELLFERKR